MTTQNPSRYRSRAIDRNRDALANNFVLRGTAASGERALEYLLRRRVGEAVKLINRTKRSGLSGKSRETLPFNHAPTQAGVFATKGEVEPFSGDFGKSSRLISHEVRLISHEVDIGSEIGVVKQEVMENLSSIEQEVDSNVVEQEMIEDSPSFGQQIHSRFVKKEAEDSEFQDSLSFEQETESTVAKQEMTEHSSTFEIEVGTSVVEHEMVNDLQSFPQEMQVSSVQHESVGNLNPFSRRANANHSNYFYEVSAGCPTHSRYPMLVNCYADSVAYSPNDTSMNYVTNQTLIHRLPPPAPEGIEVVYTIGSVEVEAWLRNNVTDCSAKAVGFDIRWKQQLNKKQREQGVLEKTAVLQLAVENSCLVLHLHHLKSRAFPKVFRSVLKDKVIRKVGSSILQNVTKLKQDRQLTCLGIVDTGEMARACGVSYSHKGELKVLAQHFLGVELNKLKSVSRSNWEKFPLSLQQIEHAAIDAWFSLKVFQHVEKELENKNCSEGAIVEQCSVCRKQFESKEALSRHVKNQHKMCFCGELFRVKINKAHKENCLAFRQAAQLTVCEACGKKCKSEVSLENHIRKAQHVWCSVCNKMLQRHALRKHEKKCKQLHQI